MILRLLPLVVFVALAAFLARGLSLDPGKLPSPLIDKPVPAFSLPTFAPEQGAFEPESMLGQVWLLNVWASWCGPCVQEHPLITELAETTEVPVIGLNYKDGNQESRQWLQRFGNPFDRVLADRDGRVGIDWGVYGVPETFVIDAAGRVRYKHVGPIDRETLDNTLRPILDELESAPS